MAGSLLLMNNDAFAMKILNLGASVTLKDESVNGTVSLKDSGATLTLEDLP